MPLTSAGKSRRTSSISCALFVLTLTLVFAGLSDAQVPRPSAPDKAAPQTPLKGVELPPKWPPEPPPAFIACTKGGSCLCFGNNACACMNKWGRCAEILDIWGVGPMQIGEVCNVSAINNNCGIFMLRKKE